jgi:hypothetical protein
MQHGRCELYVRHYEFFILKYTTQIYLRVQLAMITFRNEQYSAAADELTASITTITGLFSPAALLEPRWKVFTLVCPYKAIEDSSTHGRYAPNSSLVGTLTLYGELSINDDATRSSVPIE